MFPPLEMETNRINLAARSFNIGVIESSGLLLSALSIYRFVNPLLKDLLKVIDW